MKRSLLITMFSLTLGWAQTPTPPSFYNAIFVKTKPGKTTEYKEFIAKNSVPLAKAQIQTGKLMGYGVAQVFTPSGVDADHNFMALYGYRSWDQMEPSDQVPDYIKEATKTLGFASPQDFRAKRTSLSDAVRSEIWRRVAGTTPTSDNAPKAGEWVVVSYIKTSPGKGADYDKIWKSYSLPLQEENAKAGKFKSYSMWSVFGGNGAEAKYDRVSLIRFASFKDIVPNDNAADEAGALADKVHHGQDWRQMRREMTSLRTPYRSEIIQIKASVR